MPRPVRFQDTDAWRRWLVMDQRAVADRTDVLTYTSEVLDQPLQISGAPIANLLAANMRLSEERLGDLRSQAEATRVGEEYLGHLIDKYGTEERALAAYNGGQGNLDRGVMYPETRHYVDRVLELRGIYRKAYPSELGQ